MLAGRPSMANYKLPLMRSTHKGEFYVSHERPNGRLAY